MDHAERGKTGCETPFGKQPGHQRIRDIGEIHHSVRDREKPKFRAADVKSASGTPDEIPGVNHAHNDYLELLLELGIPGLALLLVFLVWWFWQTAQIWTAREVSLLARAATIASGALLLHSIVDFPLRTAAMAGLFAWCLAIMVTRPRTLAAPAKSEARHLKFEDLK